MKRRVVKTNAVAQAKMICLLLEGVYTCEELAAETGLHYVTVLQYTRELHRAGAAHISGWEKDNRGRDCMKLYKIGPGKDAKRRKVSASERQAKLRARQKMQRQIQMMSGAIA